MIIYGWNSKVLKNAPLQNIECEHCKEKSSEIGIVANYFHIFWIPLFPYAKKATIVCNHCGQVTTEKKMSPEFKEKVKMLKAAVPTPKYLFVGLGIIAAFIVSISVSNFYSGQKQKDFLQTPLAGDVYVLKDNDEPSAYRYYFLKVADVEEDSLLVAYNSYTYNGIPDKLEPQDGFYDVTLKIAKSDITAMNDAGEVQKIIRDYGDIEGYNRVVVYAAEEETHTEEAVTEEETVEMVGNR